ncbi:MAG: hypothetical protein HRT65_05715 [Flavobacteriaceae bacterium]|nr:hypothetical protein [Flavobacteriaceae bacterium]
MKTTPGIRIALAILIGLLSVFIVQGLLTRIWNSFGIHWGPENLPFTLPQQIGMLVSAFIGGTVGPFLALVIAKKYSLVIALFFLAIGLAIDLYAALGPLNPVATWFRIIWVLSVPVQVFLGIRIGRKILRKSAA